MQRWKKYFEELLTHWARENGKEQEFRDQVGKGNEEDAEEGNIVKIQLQEVKDAIKSIKNGKSAGFDKIKAEMIKHMEEDGQKLLLNIYN